MSTAARQASQRHSHSVEILSHYEPESADSKMSVVPRNATTYRPSLGPPPGPPYPPQAATLGNPPTHSPDLAVTCIFLVIFALAGIINMALFLRNKKQQHKFVFSMASFMFCTARVISCALRISWLYQPSNTSLALAAQIFVAVGTVVLFITNLFFSQRLMRARHPHIGWHAPFKLLVPHAAVGGTIATLVMVITCAIQQAYTLEPDTLDADSIVLRVASVWFAFVAFLPVPCVALMLSIKRRTYIDKFGAGRFRTKVVVLVTSASLLSLGACFRTVLAFLPPTRLTKESSSQPIPWYLDKACFYVFDFGVELVVILLYLLVRVDKRFYIPDAVAGPGEYACEFVPEVTSSQEDQSERTFAINAGRWSEASNHLYSEERDMTNTPYSAAFDTNSHNEDSSVLEYDMKRRRYSVRQSTSTISVVG